MNLTNSKKWICLLTAICVALSFTLPASSQTSPSWGIHDPSGTGNTLPPNQGSFVRQDPMPKSLEDITIFTSNHKSISLHIEFPDAFDSDIAIGPDGTQYNRFKADSRYHVLAQPGDPEILYRLVWLQVPYDANNIKISWTKPFYKEEKTKNIDLFPRPFLSKDTINDKGLSLESEHFFINEELYSLDAWYPQESAKISQEGFKHGMRQIQIAIPIMQYNPIQNSINELKGITLEITYSSALKDNKISIEPSRNPFHRIFINTVSNYAYRSEPPGIEPLPFRHVPLEHIDNPLWAQQTGFYPNYLVIAAEKFRHNQALLSWALHRSKFGDTHNIAIAYTGDIYQKFTGQDKKEENIKDFIQMAYDHWRIHDPNTYPSIQYLLLIGDADYGSDDQSWFLPTWRTDDPTALLGTAGDNDYAWLEPAGEEDYLNDVLIGRLPARTSQELSIMVNKIIDFEKNPPTGENHYGTRILWMAADSGYRYREIENLVREMIVDGGPFGNSPAYELEEYNHNYEGGIAEFRYDSDKITDFLNDQGALFLSFQGHGSPALTYPHWTGWHPGVTTEHLNNYEKMPLLVMSHACSTARFDYAHPEYNNIPFDSYAENWIKREEGGSVAFWGMTRLGFSSAWQDHQNFYRSIIEDGNRHLGIILDEMRTYFPKNFFYEVGSIPFDPEYLHHKIHVLLGDPAITFDNHLKPSTKPDFSVQSTQASNVNPTHPGCTLSINATISNKSGYDLDNVPYALFSVNHGELEQISDIDHVRLTHETPTSLTKSWIYQGESSKQLMFWIDPHNTIDVRSKFNNHINSTRKYYSVYVDQNHQGVQYGTRLFPYRNLNAAINHALEKDEIGEYHREKGGRLQIWIKTEGEYGTGELHHIDKSLSIKGFMSAPNQISIYDQFSFTGKEYIFRDVTLDGRKHSGPGVIIPDHIPSSDGSSGTSRRFRRTTFKNFSDYAVHAGSRILLENCLFFNNHGVVKYINPEELVGFGITFNHTTAFSNHFNICALNTTNRPRILRIDRSIFWNNGPSLFPQELHHQSKIFVNYTDIDDEIILENLTQPGEGNINEDPKFMNPAEFNLYLKPNSPCIGAAGAAGNGLNPDGSPADMGAYGGSRAKMRPLRITYPIHGEAVLTRPNPFGTIPINISWKTPYRNQPSNVKVHIKLYYYNYQRSASRSPDSGGIGYNAEKVIELDTITTNSGLFPHLLQIGSSSRTYHLEITLVDFPEEKEKINFKIIQGGPSSIRSNR